MNSGISHYLDSDAHPVKDTCREIIRFAKKSINLLIPSIQIVYYPNKDILAYSLNLLKQNAIDDKVAIQEVNILKGDDPFSLVKDRRTIYAVYGVHGQVEIVRRLNWRREYITDNLFNVVIFVNYTELTDLSERAPDFWAFKNRFYILQAERVALDKSFDISKFEPTIQASEEFISSERATSLEEMIFGETFLVNAENSHFIVELLKYAIQINERNLAIKILDEFTKYLTSNINIEDYIEFRLLTSVLLSSSGENSAAIDMLKKDLKKLDPISDKYLEIIILQQIARTYIRLNDLSTAQVYARKALKAHQKSAKDVHSGSTKLLFIDIYIKKGDYTKALSIISDDPLIDDQTIIGFMVSESEIHNLKGNPAKTIETVERYYDKLTKKSFEAKLQRSVILGRAYQNMGDYDRAIKNIEEAINILQQNQINKSFVAQLLLVVARNAYYDKNLEHAEAKAYQAIEMADEPDTSAICYELLGSIYEERDNNSKAISNYKHALELAVDVNIRYHITSSLTKTYIDINDSHNALLKSTDGLSLAASSKNISNRFNAKFQHGIALHLSNYHSEAVLYLDEAANFYKENSNTFMLGNTLEWEGVAYFSLNNFEKATEALKIALQISNSEFDLDRSIHILSYLADSSFMLRRYDQSIIFSQQALRLSIDIKDIRLIASQLVRLARYYFEIHREKHFIATMATITEKITPHLDEEELEDLTLLQEKLSKIDKDFAKSIIMDLRRVQEASLGIDSAAYFSGE